MVWGREIKREGKKMGEIKIAREKRERERERERERKGERGIQRDTKERVGEMRGI